LDLLSPNGGNLFRVGSPVDITWNSEMVGDLTLSYKTCAGCDWVVVEENIPVDNQLYQWMPDIPSMWCKVQLSETENPAVADESNNVFLVYQLDLTTPEGGENYIGGEVTYIEWESEIINDVLIEFSSDNGQTWSTQATVSASDLSFEWTIPHLDSEECYIKLTTPGLPDNYSMNALPFSITHQVGIENISNDEDGLTIFPTPVLDNLTLSFTTKNESNDPLELKIFAMSGEIVVNQLYQISQPGEQLLHINVSHLTSGMYLIKIENENKNRILKFIKE
jgi:hypothetical protein